MDFIVKIINEVTYFIHSKIGKNSNKLNDNKNKSNIFVAAKNIIIISKMSLFRKIHKQT